MKIAFRNFLTTLRRYKISSLLNVIGLTLAFTAFYVIMTQVWWELGYNRSLHEADRIYLVENEDWYEPGKWSSWLNRPVPERVIASTAGVEVGGCMWGGFGSGTCWTSNEPSFGYNKFSASCGSVSLPFLDVFAFRSVEGDVHDLGKPKSVIVSREAAERMRVGVGSLIWVDTDEPQPDGAMEVVAVFEDFPDNSLLGECEVVKNLGETNLYTTSEWSFNYFVKFRPGADPDEFARQWTNVNQEMQREAAEKRAAAGDAADDDDESGIYGVRLSPVSELYFESDSQAPCRQGSVVTTYTLLGIAVLVIVLAFINFVNFFFALVPVRIRTVNTFKVFGAPASSLRFNFVFEAFGLVLIALLAAWYVSFALQGTEFASYISASLALSQNLEVVGLVAVVAFVMALAASLYPAWYITSFAPALVVKGSFGGTRSGRRLRTLLLGVQFFISIGLIIATSFIRLQHDYMMHYDMGFDKENLLAVRLSERGAASYDALRQKLLSDPQVKDVTGATSRLVSVGRMGWGREFKGRQVAFQSYVVQPDFLRVMGIPITDGRDFLESDFDKELGTMIFNEAARREFEMQVGDRINGFVSPDEQIVGFCADFNFKPLQYGVSPFCFYLLPKKIQQENYWHLPHVVYVRMTPGADIAAVTAHIRRCIAEVDPRTEPGDIVVRVFDEELGLEYDNERKLTAIVGLFALLAVVIALMGVFGLVLFETQHRRREIAVRRVMGASRGEILAMFNRRYVMLVAVCFVLAVPVSIWAVRHWLAGFAYAVPLYWWVFALALAGVLAVTALTVTVRSWRAVNENPAESVKSE
ncbi:MULTISPECIES: ABC transporter permease [Alistipes]|jgi:putative ABC transport system permease protein|uniref:ABC transporter permease n=1 Tax=Alistipes TaxID=239759 RepID=UPI000364E2C4|nr:ABC transporter permease [Alistipes onderdonkii]MBE5047628.1 ABC transporter permease [Alistipes onderdonkii]UWN63461.1 ABC transporter permease [Alistipes onderdonkii]BDE90532.1 ABC transporter permease [Alistipes onderdonkii]GKG95745.1 ABC transporter permease [Alistipes onderdonkii]